MKLLLDENFPQKVKLELVGHKFITIDKVGWKGKKNSELLELMANESFDGLVTLDWNLSKQQNLEKFDIKIFVLKSKDSRPSSIKPLIDKLYESLVKKSSQQVVEIE